MDRIEKMILKAKALKDPPLKPWEKAMQHNNFINRDNDELLELLVDPQDNWRQIIQAMAWNGGVVCGTDTA